MNNIIIKKYRKKPVIIEAVQWDGTYKGYLKIKEMFPDLIDDHLDYHPKYNKVYGWKILTLENSYTVNPKDYIIKNNNGEFYPCKPDIFEKTYEEVE